jgi:hypothetical protein
MALESATYISGLVDTNPSGSDSISQGDDHLRLIKEVLKNTLPNADEAINGVHTSATSPTPNTSGQMWFDTSGVGELKVRDKANTGWDTLSGKITAVSHGYRQGGYTDIRSTTMTDTSVSVAHTKLTATSTLYVIGSGAVQVWSSFNTGNPQAAYVQLVYATNTTTGITPSGAVDAGYLKEAGLETASSVQIGLRYTYIWKCSSLAAAAYTFKVQGKCEQPTDGGAEFTDGSMFVLEVEA